MLIAIHGVPPEKKWTDRGVTTFIAAGLPLPKNMGDAAYCAAAADLGAKAWIPPGNALTAQSKLPGFGGWALRDEPEGKIEPGAYRDSTHRLKGRGFPIFGNFTHALIDGLLPVSAYRTYTEGLTTWGFDYHILNRGQALEQGFQTWERVVDGMRMAAGRDKPFLVSVETGPHLPTSAAFSVEKFRALCFKAKDLGAAGLVLFTIREPRYGGFSWDVTPPAIAEAMPSIFEELNAPPEIEVVKKDRDLARAALRLEQSKRRAIHELSKD